MDLTQMMLVICGLAILGMPVPGSNRTVLETTDAQKDSEFGINAVSLDAITIVEMTLQVESPYRVQDQVHQDRSFGKWSTRRRSGGRPGWPPATSSDMDS